MKICSASDIKKLYEDGSFVDLILNLPHARDIDDPLIRFLMDSNLLKMREYAKSDTLPLTVGADPEFIVCKKGTKEVVLFSSKYASGRWNLSEAAVGADYGLMELRTPIFEGADDLIKYVGESLANFTEDYEKLDILKSEAVEFNHQRERVLESLLEEKRDYGVRFHRKEQDVWGDVGGMSIEGLEMSGLTLSAYSKPIFAKPNPNIFSAGGHIHVGGGYVKMLSYEQLKALIREIDQVVLPLCQAVESEAGKLRREVYGFPGEFRVKPYGFEYRSLSNAVFHKENLKVLRKIINTIIDLSETFALKASE
jgi:hypothetical protein